jgi:glycosyltransferase involved in cell wall biosynthesis
MLAAVAPGAHWQAEDEVTALPAETAEEWQEQLLWLVNDAPLRRRIGEAARAEVLAKHTLEARRPRWEALLADAARGRMMPAEHLRRL